MLSARPVFIHGSGGGQDTWSAQARQFAGAVYVALSGHPLGVAHALVAEHAEEVSRVIAETNGPCVLVGHSLGGAVALQTALDWPVRVAGVVLVATGARLPVPNAAFERVRTDFAGECERVVRAGLVREDPDLVAAGLARMAAAGQSTVEADYRACAGFDAREWMSEVDVPALVVTGSEDPLTPVWMSEELAAGLPNAQLVVVPQASHSLIEENAQEFDLLLAGFLARIEGRQKPAPDTGR